MSFRVFKSILMIALSGLALSSCAAPILTPSSLPTERRPPPPQGAEEVSRIPAQPSPRVLASLRLTDQGRMLLERGKTDDAISLLERAVSLHPTNGKNYYYLAEAWLVKGNRGQAKEFNHLADTYLKEDPYWIEKVLGQRKRIEVGNESGQGE